MDQLRTCKKCLTEQPIENFYKVGSGKDKGKYRSRECKACVIARTGKYQREHPEQTRASGRKSDSRPERRLRSRDPETRLKNRHGISQAEYNARFQDQGGVCAICSDPPDPTKHHSILQVDHDHHHCDRCASKTRKACGNGFRGLLCNRCNNLLRAAEEDVLLLEEAINYLNRWRELLSLDPMDDISE